MTLTRFGPRALLLAVVVFFTTACIGLPRVADGAGASTNATLNVRSFSVEPRFARPGQTVTIRAAIRNDALTPATNLQLRPGLASPTTAQPRWIVTNATMSGPIAELAPGATVNLSVDIQILDGGMPKVGALIVADQAALPPRSVVVRVGDATSLGYQATILAAVLSPLVLALILLVRTAWIHRARTPSRRAALAGGGGLVIALAVWSWPALPDRRIAYAGLASFMLAWQFLSLVPRPNTRLPVGYLVGTASYLLIGMLWTVVQGIGVRRLPLETVLAKPSLPSMWLWPFELVQMAGLVTLPVG
jgi:hypothetical protein